MATKAQTIKAWELQTKRGKQAAPKRAAPLKPAKPKRTAKPKRWKPPPPPAPPPVVAESSDESTIGQRPSKPAWARNWDARAGRKAQVELEVSAGKPSRKSTRGSANRGKPGSNLTRRTQRAVRTPEARATQAQAKASVVRGRNRGKV